MKITYKGDYALKIILDLALLYNQGKTSIKEISKRQDIPRKFLEQIVTILKSAGYLKTERGSGGGISLSKDPAKITLGEIIRLIEGPTSPITCVSRSKYTKCDFEAKCALRTVFEKIRDRTSEIIDKTTFKDMVDKTKSLQKNIHPDYVI
ncbi:MAG: Rrf2 family transcriptional regulator [Elusimicrobia bacterium]|nr:Rrf2 family transcriptional regulator [Elusimicrobiota bacterium]